MRRRQSKSLEKEREVDALLDLLNDDEQSVEDLIHELGKDKKGTLVGGVLTLSSIIDARDEKIGRDYELCDALHRKNEKLKCFIARLKCGLAH